MIYPVNTHSYLVGLDVAHLVDDAIGATSNSFEDFIRLAEVNFLVEHLKFGELELCCGYFTLHLNINKMEKQYYDKKYWNPIHYRKKRPSEGATHEFGIELEGIIPKPGEVRLLGNRNNQCSYYLHGVEYCKYQAEQLEKGSYISCKPHLDATYRCYTESKYGKSILDAPEEAKPYLKSYMDCLFTPNTSGHFCQNHLIDGIRAIYRSEDNTLNDNF